MENDRADVTLLGGEFSFLFRDELKPRGKILHFENLSSYRLSLPPTSNPSSFVARIVGFGPTLKSQFTSPTSSSLSLSSTEMPE